MDVFTEEQGLVEEKYICWCEIQLYLNRLWPSKIFSYVAYFSEYL